MSSTSFTVLRCDRCGQEMEIRKPGDDLGWGKIFARVRSGDERERGIGSASVADDACPKCSAELLVWFGNIAPAPAPSPPATPRPAFTDEMRHEAIARTEEALRAQALEAFLATRDKPASIVSGEPAPAIAAGAADRAERLVDAIIGAKRRKRGR